MPHRVFNKNLFQLSDSAFSVCICITRNIYMKSCTNGAIPKTLRSGASLQSSDCLNIKYISNGAVGDTKACKRAFPTLNIWEAL